MSDELKVTVDLANVPAVVQALKEAQAAIDAMSAELTARRSFADSVPWAALYDPSEAHNRYDIERWYDAHVRKEGEA